VHVVFKLLRIIYGKLAFVVKISLKVWDTEG